MTGTRFMALESRVGSLLLATRVDAAVRRLRRTAVPILMYHSITADSAPPDGCLSLAGMLVRESHFRQHMAYIATHYTGITLTDYVKWREGRHSLPRNPCIITFDDGFADAHDRVLPILNELGLKATVFVIGSTVTRPSFGPDVGSWLHELYAILDSAAPEAARQAFVRLVDGFPDSEISSKPALRSWARRHFAGLDPDYRAGLLERLREAVGAVSSGERWSLSGEQLRRIAQAGFEIGSHSMSHDYLARLSDVRLDEDISESRKVIEPLRGRHWPTFCYPFGGPGAWDSRTVKALRKHGFACAVSSIEGLNGRRTDLYGLRRIRVTGDLPLNAFAFRLLGCRSLLWKLYVALRRLQRRSS